MKRKQDKPQKPTNVSPAIQETSKRIRKNNENSVSDMSSNDGSERAESNSSMDSHGYELRSKDPPVLDDNNDDLDANSIPERNLQPQVYFNSNLRKIKIEDDFVPIKEESDEDVEGKHNEIAQINSPSVSVESRNNNTSCAGNDDVDNHEFQMLDSERGQVQQEEEMEADDNENETEEKEEMKNISNLEEGIKKYTQQMVSLYRDKTEKQTTLQNKVDQLNLVIGQLKTEIQDLNSTVTLQRDENNQLKSQMVEKQKEIDDLNSTVIVQRDENNRLQSQVAKQQRQIEELNNKLQLSAENQQPTETFIKVVATPSSKTFYAENQQSVDHSIANTEPNPHAKQIQDLPTKVLSLIFGYLDIKSLKKSRFVSRQWRNEAGKILLKNFYLTFNDKERCENSLINWLTNSDVTATTFLKLCLLYYQVRGALPLLRKCLILRNSIRELKILHRLSFRNATSLCETLQLLPNLQVIEANSLDLLGPRQMKLGFPRHSDIPLLKLDLLVPKLQNMEKLKLEFQSKEAVEFFFTYCQHFASLKNMEIHAGGICFINEFFKQPKQNWAISRFTFHVHPMFNMKLTRKFLIRISPSLQHLKFIKEKSDSSSSPLEPWTDDWVIPIGLNRLETLEIEQRCRKATQFSVKSILPALRLPRLKRLAIDYSPFGIGKELEETIQNWNSHESANGRTLSSESLEELEILPLYERITKKLVKLSKIPGHPWPGLKSLKCSWKDLKTFDPSVLSELGNLERLELIISWNINWESKNNGTKYNRNDNNFQLRDLKKLKSFSLKFPVLLNNTKQASQDFANHLVQNDLKFMKNLQFIEFHGVSIDVEPLKTAFGPHVPIIVIN